MLGIMTYSSVLFLLLFWIFSFCSGLNVTEVADFNGHHVVRVFLESKKDLTLMQRIARNRRPKLDFWTHPVSRNQTTLVSVSAANYPLFHKILKQQDVRFEIMTKNLQSLIDQERLDHENARHWSSRSGFNLNQYHRHKEINAWLHSVASSPICAGICQIFNLGRSHEGREMIGLKIGISGKNKKAVWIDGGIHAREWISPATVLNILYHFLQEHANGNRGAANVLAKFDIYILPVVNPDGYEHSWEKNRLWRKNTKAHPEFLGCHGVDLNRNWGYHWMAAGADSHPCSDIFAGDQAMSEPETRNVGNFILAKKGVFKVFLTFHSYGQYWLTPWGYTSKTPTDYRDLVAKARVATRKIASYRGLKYQVGSSTRLLYAAAGGSDDWAKGVAGVPYSFTIELPDEGRYGFILPATEIRPVGLETYAGVKQLLKSLY